MFTGLIEETGKVIDIQKTAETLYISIQCSDVLNGLRIGDSIAVNGACQTVIEMNNDSFKVFASSETLKITNFNILKAGDIVNLERALKLSDRLDGHLVTGHIDSTGILKNIDMNGDNITITVDVNSAIAGQIVKKGSVALNGISLTVSDILEGCFKVAIIPHTFNNTNLKYLKRGSVINIETDIIAKYVEKYLLSNNNTNKTSSIDIKLLAENGFI